MYVESNPDYHAPDIMASEYETQRFLNALVFMLKPLTVAETGCYEGHASLSMVQALQKNGQGHLHTCDTDESKVAKLQLLTARKALPMTAICCTGEDMLRSLDSVDFAFLDSSGDRIAEAKALKLSKRGVVILHDSKRRPVFDAIREMHSWKAVWEAPTPRGLACFFL